MEKQTLVKESSDHFHPALWCLLMPRYTNYFYERYLSSALKDGCEGGLYHYYHDRSYVPPDVDTTSTVSTL